MHNDSLSGFEYTWTRIIIFSAVRKVYLSILFLHFSLSVQLNCSEGHHLGVMPVSITQWPAEIGIFLTIISWSLNRGLHYCYVTIAK